MFAVILRWLMVLLAVVPKVVQSDNSPLTNQSICQAEITNQKPLLHPIDKSWIEYMKHVYNTDDTSIIPLSLQDINFIYRNGPIEINVLEWNHRKPISALENDWGDTFFRYSDKTYLSDEWAEVSRYSTSYLQRFRGMKDEWVEGLSQGMSGKYTSEQEKVPYGCWFNLAKGSGIFVNVGRTIVVPHKYDAGLYATLGLTSKGCLVNSSTSPSHHDNCYDRYLCTAALEKGFQSIQITDHSEMVFCADQCASQELHHTCPQIELRSGVNASQPCSCSDDKYLLNCDGNHESLNSVNKAFIDPSLRALAQDQLLSSSPRHRSCLSRHPSGPSNTEFNLTIAFTVGVLHRSESLLPKLDHLLQRFSAADTVLVDVGGGGTATSGKLPGHTALQAISAALLGAVNSTIGKPLRRLHGHHDEGSEREHHSFDHHRNHDHVSDSDRDVEHHHHHHRHDHNEVAHDPSSAVSSADPVFASLWKAGYRAVGFDASYVALQRSPLLPVLSLTAQGLDRSTIVVSASGVRVGVMAYHMDAADQSHTALTALIRLLQDEAMCLRKMGADVVVLMLSSGDITRLHEVAVGAKGYIDAILGAHHQPRSCQGQWHSGESGVVIVQIDSNPDSVGVLNIRRDAVGCAFNSEILHA